MIVIDASALLEVLLGTPVGMRVERKMLAESLLHAPHLLDVEVSQVLRRLSASGELTAQHGRRLLDLLVQFPIERYAHEPLLARMWALRTNLTSYDACYVALAEALGATLLTCDQKLGRSPGHRAGIEVVE